MATVMQKIKDIEDDVFFTVPSMSYDAKQISAICNRIKITRQEYYLEIKDGKDQKNKATAHHLGLLKAKLAKLRRELLTPTSKGGGGAGEGFDVTKSGDAIVGLVGFPSVGKLTLLNKLTDTFSEVASYEFTTLTCIPDLETVKPICSEYRIHNADVTLRFDATVDDLIDVIEGSRIYTPCIYVVNKIDQITLEELEILDKLPHYCPV
ncbi:hypothetical protein L2E82_20523 [Cichorium intybus]|uniref:Uncharacterized protein n=1 Tax=Cichorium intybus TaxID=13427 RepID=A0ACB9DTA7_CICIN|nr:hypothetical protein L2E82_20523 [Cichorium intybus]